MNIIELAKEAGYDEASETIPSFQQFIERFADLVRAEREWVDLEPWQLCEIEERLCLPIDSHDFETIGNAYIAAFKEKNK